jgi:RimJ/RimL family protein N-acetyltransferase
LGVLREVVDDDLPILHEYECEPEAAAMAGFPSRGREAFMAHWAKTRASDAALQWTIVCDGEVAGNIGCWQDGGQRFVGYWIGRRFWGRGLATQALREVLELVDERPVHAHVLKGNAGSVRVLEKCGFAVVDEHRDDKGVEELLLALG